MKQKTTLPPSTLQGQYAGFVSRFLAYIIDLLVVIAIVTILGLTADIILRFFRIDEFIASLLSTDNLLGDVLRATAFLGSIAFVNFAYFVIIWTVTAGRSVGKLLIGVRIVPLNGSRISIFRAIIRYFAFILAALPLFIGLLWFLISDRRQGWHDKIAGTCVIYDWPAREDDGMIGRVQSRWHSLKHTRRLIRTKRAERKSKKAAAGTAAVHTETEGS